MTLRFDEATHTYYDVGRGRVVPSVTEMLEQTGWINTRFYTPGSAERGDAVHRLLAAYDLMSVDVPSCVSAYRPWLLSYKCTADVVRPRWLHVEEPFIHEGLGFGGRPDRVGYVYDRLSVVDLKSGGAERAHPIQTALQAILVAPTVGLPPRSIGRFGWYVKAKGLSKLFEFPNARDFDEAYRIIRTCCG